MDGSGDVQISQVFSRPHLPIRKDDLVTVEDCRRWDHLRKLGIQSLEDVSSADLLIGLDRPDALIPLSGPVSYGDGGRQQSFCVVSNRHPESLSTPDPDPSEVDLRMDQRLEERLARLWELESSGLYDTTRSR